MNRTPVLLFVALTLTTIIAPARVVAAQDALAPVLVADVEGVPIPATSASDYHCHDFDYPFIHCFRTSQALDAAANRFALRSESSLEMAVLAVDYVRIFEYTALGGNSFYVSQDYSNLGVIGWNDRISSYRSMNSETGVFYTDVVYAGAVDSFCCNQSVSLTSTLDNRFSSVRRT